MKKIIYLSLFLGLVSAVVTGAMAGVNTITAPIIAEAQYQAFRAAVNFAFPTADNFEILAEGEEIESPHIIQILEVFEGGEPIGFIYHKIVPGFGGPINYMMGIDFDGNFTSFSVLSHSETPGFGARIVDEPDFAASLIGTHAGSQIDILTGATNTTTPIVRAIGELHQDFMNRR
ncbi:MAG: FMN-binding protein [Defluviitaleaceae bacterium]|nr:FMN-binding protein [Defluviitaleaceae bacterium]